MNVSGGRHKQKFTPTFHLLDASRNVPSIGNLPPALTINNITVYPTLRYKGGDAGSTIWKPWGYPQSELGLLYLQAGTAPTYNAGSPLLGKHDDSVLFNAGGYYLTKTGVKDLGDVGVNDLVFHILFKPSASDVLISKRNAGVGWQVGCDATPALYLTIQDAGGAVTVTSAALVAGVWYDAWIFVDRNGSAQIYINAAASGVAVDFSGAALTLDSTNLLSIGADSAGATPYASNVALVELYSYPSWLDSHLQPTVVQTRFALLNASKPLVSKAGDTYPVVQGSTSTTYQEKILDSGARRIFSVGASYPRTCEVLDARGRKLIGTLVEPAGTNYCTAPRALDTWAPEGAPTITTGQLGPDGNLTSFKIEGIEGTGVATIYEAADGSAGANGTPICTSMWIKRISTSGVLAMLSSNGDGNGKYTIDMANLPDYWVRVYPGSPYLTVVTPHTVWGDGRNGLWLARDSGVAALNFYADFVQYEVGSFFSSEIPIYGTRVADSCYYTFDSNVINATQGTVKLKVWVPKSWSDTVNYHNLLDLTDAAATNRFLLYLNTSQQVACYIDPDAGSVNVPTAINDGEIHDIMFSWCQTKLDIWVDKERATTTISTPTGMTRLYVGGRLNNTNNAGPIVVSDVRIYDKYIPNWESTGY